MSGGANVAQQAGLIDDMEIHLVPVPLGDGARLFDNLGDAEVELTCVRAIEAPGATHLGYRVVRRLCPAARTFDNGSSRRRRLPTDG